MYYQFLVNFLCEGSTLTTFVQLSKKEKHCLKEKIIFPGNWTIWIPIPSLSPLMSVTVKMWYNTALKLCKQTGSGSMLTVFFHLPPYLYFSLSATYGDFSTAHRGLSTICSTTQTLTHTYTCIYAYKNTSIFQTYTHVCTHTHTAVNKTYVVYSIRSSFFFFL